MDDLLFPILWVRKLRPRGHEVACPRLQWPRTQVGVTQAQTRRRKYNQTPVPNLVPPQAAAELSPSDESWLEYG